MPVLTAFEGGEICAVVDRDVDIMRLEGRKASLRGWKRRWVGEPM